MTKFSLTAVAVLAGLAFAGPAVAATTATFGYIDLKDDVRYHPQVAYTRIQIAPAIHPVEGARLGLEDSKDMMDAAQVSLTMDEQQAADANDAIAKIQAMVAAGERFVVLDLPGDMVTQVATTLKDTKVTLFNVSAPQDAIRALCLPNLFNVDASDRMIADSYMQFLRHRNWTKVLVLQGDQPRDKEMADAFQQSAQRLQINIVARKQFTLSTDPANRDNNNTQLITGGMDYDIVYIADSLGEYARSLNYATQLPRPVIGATGLTAEDWHWSWSQDSATQVTLRFQRESEGNRVMSAVDWDAWMATKAVATAYSKSRTDDPDKIDAYLRGKRMVLDGSKGVRLDFRPWDRQLRMPIVLHTNDAIIEKAPFDEFLHQTNTLDTLGVDQPESKCPVPQQ